MQKWLIFIITTALIMTAGISAIFWSVKNKEKIVTTEEYKTDENATPFKIIPLRDDVFVKSGNDVEKHKIEKTIEALPVSLVSTSLSGRAVMESPAGIKTLLDSESQIEITVHEEDGDKTALSLIFGSTWSRVEKIFEKGEFYELKTRNAAAVVRGTSFGINFQGETTTILIAKGIVFVYEVGKSGNILPNTGIPVNAGEKAIRRGQDRITVSRITALDMNSEWYKFNNPIPEPPTVELKPGVTAKPPPPDIPVSTPIQINPPPAENIKPIFDLNEVRPRTAVAGKDLVTLKGYGFLRTNALLLGLLRITSYKIVSNTEIEFIVPISIEPRIYDISIIDIEGQSDTLRDALTVQAPPPEPKPEPEPSPQPPRPEESPTQDFLLKSGQEPPPPQ